MEYENTVDDVQEEVVDLPDETEPVASEAEEQEPAIPGQEPERPIQTPAENAAFAAMRRDNERLMRENAERDALFASLFPDTEDPFLMAQAQIYNKTPDQISAEREAAAELSRKDAELESLRAYRAQSAFEKDLSAIKTAYPEIQAKSIDELGTEYMRIMATGALDAVTAYEIVRAKEAKQRKAAPPDPGKVNASSKADKNFFTREEVRGMTQEEVSKNWSKIEKSRAKWK